MDAWWQAVGAKLYGPETGSGYGKEYRVARPYTEDFWTVDMRYGAGRWGEDRGRIANVGGDIGLVGGAGGSCCPGRCCCAGVLSFGVDSNGQ